MTQYDMKIHSNPDAQAWAKFFIHTKEKASWQIEDIDESLMLAWFANAMMAMHDYLKSQRTWVDLTDEEIQVVAKQARSKDHAVTLTNKLLREKNT